MSNHQALKGILFNLFCVLIMWVVLPKICAEDVFFANKKNTPNGILKIKYQSKSDLGKNSDKYEIAVLTELNIDKAVASVEINGLYIISDSYVLVNSSLRNKKTNEVGALPWYFYSNKLNKIEGGIMGSDPVMGLIYQFVDEGIKLQGADIVANEFTEYSIDMPEPGRVSVSINKVSQPNDSAIKLLIRSTDILSGNEKKRLTKEVLSESKDFIGQEIKYALKVDVGFFACLDNSDIIIPSDEISEKAMLSALGVINYL